jgi:hypothetical protein
MRRDKQFEARLLMVLLAAALVAAILSFSKNAFGQTRPQASSMVYQPDVKRGYRKYRTYRVSYRRSRSRIAAVAARAATVSHQQASRVVPSETGPPVASPHLQARTEAGHRLLIDPVPAFQLFEPYYKTTNSDFGEPLPQWLGPVMLERGDPEPPPISHYPNLHLTALGAIAAALLAACVFAVINGERDERPETQWPEWPHY